ncbi:MAG: hypothetical protein ACYDIE_01655 [Candidatus Krumholzibacteriia bacterium]
MAAKVWLAQLWAENLLGVLARSRTLYEELAWLVGRGEQARVLAVLPLCYQQPVKNPVDAYLRAWGYLRPLATPADTGVFLRLLQERDPALNPHLYRLVLRHGLWYLYNSRLFPAAACPDRFWTVLAGGMSQVVLTRDGADVRPWAWFAQELDPLADADRLAARAEAELVLLRVGGDLFWNPKLEGLPGSGALIERLRAAGRAVCTGRRREAAAG